MKYGVYPDIACFGKAISNGYAFGAVIGRRDVMEAAQSTFISSTYYTENVGFSAALATVRKFVKLNVHEHIAEMGTYFQACISALANETGLNVTVGGLPCFVSFSFNYPNGNAIRTLYTQAMLDRNYLVKAGLYPSYAHTKSSIDDFKVHVKEVFAYLKSCIDNDTVEKELRGPEAHSGFARLT